MAEITVDPRHDLSTDVTVVGLVGVLDMSTAPKVRQALSKSVAECPSAVIVDMRTVQVAAPLALTVLPSASRQPPQLPDVPLLLCIGPRTLQGGVARTAVGRLPIFDSIDGAMTYVKEVAESMYRVNLPLPPTAESPGRARDCVNAVCSEWGIEHIAKEARLVVSELVTNAVSHGGSGIAIELMLRGPFLHVRVRDDSSAEPRLRHGKDTTLGGRGLRLVDLYSSGWGFLRGACGKVVWATLRARPVGA
jgi:anti-sigma regulatory factor (Ser/Thr protein kinase)